MKDCTEAGKAGLEADTVRDATQAEVEALKQADKRLKQLVAELSLQNLVLKKTAVPKYDPPKARPMNGGCSWPGSQYPSDSK